VPGPREQAKKEAARKSRERAAKLKAEQAAKALLEQQAKGLGAGTGGTAAAGVAKMMSETI